MAPEASIACRHRTLTELPEALRMRDRIEWRTKNQLTIPSEPHIAHANMLIWQSRTAESESYSGRPESLNVVLDRLSRVTEPNERKTKATLAETILMGVRGIRSGCAPLLGELTKLAEGWHAELGVYIKTIKPKNNIMDNLSGVYGPHHTKNRAFRILLPFSAIIHTASCKRRD
jgi:hypothetical protein